MEQSSSTYTLANLKKLLRRSPYLPFILVGLVVLALLAFAVRSFTSQPVTQTIAGETDQVKLEKPKAEQKINKTFEFPLRDEKGKEVSKVKYTIEKAELRDEIIVKGQKATAVEGRTFLILNLKITNDFDKSIQISAKDYIRLTVSGSSEKLAADIHNDPVEVQAISTKLTRIGFPVNESDRNFTLQVGEINGKKETVKLSF